MFSYCLGIYIWLCWKLNLQEIVFLSQDHNQLDLTELNHNVSCLVWGSAYQAHIHYIWSSMATGGSSELPDAFDYTGHLFFFSFLRSFAFPGQWFSSLSVHQNHLRRICVLLRHRLLHSKSLWSWRLGWTHELSPPSVSLFTFVLAISFPWSSPQI